MLKEKTNIRYNLPDLVRGCAVIAMIVYHTLWDLVYSFGVSIPWFHTAGASVFQGSIRWTFILLSGFCVSLGRKKLRRALTVHAGGLIITIFSLIAMPDDAIIFGILTFMGTAMLLAIPLEGVAKRIHPFVAIPVLSLLFVLSYKVSFGVVSFGPVTLFQIPEGFYANYFTAFLGFFFEGFSSADYVPLIPWIFLFFIGHYIYLALERYGGLPLLCAVSFKPLEWVGRLSLYIYVIHQPVIYGILYLAFR